MQLEQQKANWDQAVFRLVDPDLAAMHPETHDSVFDHFGPFLS